MVCLFLFYAIKTSRWDRAFSRIMYSIVAATTLLMGYCSWRVFERDTSSVKLGHGAEHGLVQSVQK